MDDYRIETTPAHVDRELNCPFCGHNNIEVHDENDGYGRHIVSFMCDAELAEESTKGFLGCDVTIEINDYNVEECKMEYRRLHEKFIRQSVEHINGRGQSDG